MSRKSSPQKMRVIIGEACYHMTVEQIPSNSLNPDRAFKCPYCKRKLRIIAETDVFGTFEDKFTLKLACVPHEIVFLYNYSISHQEDD